MSSLRDKTVSGIFWSFLQKIGAKGVSFLVMILLARLLTPKDFGLIGMIMIFIQISQAIVEGGFKQALIQKKHVDDEDYSSIFYINLIVGIFFYGLLYFSAPLIASFYKQPLLVSLTRVLSLVFVINAFSIVQESRLTKEMQFKKLMLIHVPSTIIGGLASIVMAFNGYGVWSIVVMQLLTTFIYALQIWLYAKWKPLLAFNKKKVKGLLSFGSKLLLSRLITTIYNNLYLVIIGKFYPVKSVGYYQNSFNLVNTPSSVITRVVGDVTFPVFSGIQDDNKKLKSGYRRAIEQVFFWICPLYIFAGVLATPLFELLFTAKWLPAVPYFRWLCVFGIFQPLIIYNSNVILIKGRSDIFLRLQIIRRTLTVVGIFVVFPLGITALLLVQALSSIFSFCLFGYYTGKFIDYSVFEQLKSLFPTIVVSVIVGLGAWALDEFVLDTTAFLKVVIGFSLSLMTYLIISHLFEVEAFREFRAALLPKLGVFFSKQSDDSIGGGDA